MRLHCSLMPNIMAFKTPDESGFLVFGVSNAKYLAFDTPNENALRHLLPWNILLVQVSPANLKTSRESGSTTWGTRKRY